jgi:Holliday junction resolvasome RuvABC endonuclease subunit
MPGVVGIDLAQRHSGVCYIPESWCGNPDDLQTYFYEYSLQKKLDPETKIRVMLSTAEMVINAVGKHGVKHVAIEQYAFGVKSSSVTDLAELGGVVRSQLWLAHEIAVKSVVSSSARKTLMGAVRKKRKTDVERGIKPLDEKAQVRVFLKNRGIEFSNDDIMDSFVIGYYYWFHVNNGVYKFKPVDEMEQVVPIGVRGAYSRRKQMEGKREGGE